MLTTSPVFSSGVALPFLSRYIFPVSYLPAFPSTYSSVKILSKLVDENQWRDAGIISRLMRAVDPSVSIETSSYWKDLIDLNRIVFKRVALINRATAETQ